MTPPHAPRQLLTLTGLLLASLVLPACERGDQGAPSAASAQVAPALHNPEGGGQLAVVDAPNPGRPFFHDFGTLPYGERASHVFRLQNRGQVPVGIQRAQGACACTRLLSLRVLREEGPPLVGRTSGAEPLVEVPPGATFELEIGIDTTKTHANTDKLAIMRVLTDAELDPYLSFELHFLGERLFELSPATVNLGEVPLVGGLGTTIQVFNRLRHKPARLVEVVETSPELEASLEPVQGGSDNFWNLTVRLAQAGSLGGYRGQVVLSHTDAEGQGDAGRLEIPVFASVTEPIILTPFNLSFGALRAGQPQQLEASLRCLLPGQRVEVLRAELSGPSAEHLSVEVQPLGVDDEGRAGLHTVTVQAAASLPPGKVEARLRLVLDDSGVPELERPVMGVVRP